MKSLLVGIIYGLSIGFFIAFTTELSIRYSSYEQLTDYSYSEDVYLKPHISICLELQKLYPKMYKNFVSSEEFRKTEPQKMFLNSSESIYMKDNHTLCWKFSNECVGKVIFSYGDLPAPISVGLHDGFYLQSEDFRISLVLPYVFIIFRAYHTERLERNCHTYEDTKATCWQSCVSTYYGGHLVHFPSSGNSSYLPLNPKYNSAIDGLCSKKCFKADCKNTVYKLISFGAQKSRKNGMFQYRLSLESLKTLIRYKLQMSLEVYILTIISIFGISFDISALSLLSQVVALIKHRISRAVKCFVRLAICVAFTFQVVQIAMSYFRYDISTEVYVGVPRYLAYPKVSLCDLEHRRLSAHVEDKLEGPVTLYLGNRSYAKVSKEKHERFYILKAFTCWNISPRKDTYLPTDTTLFTMYTDKSANLFAIYISSNGIAHYGGKLFRAPVSVTYDVKRLTKLSAPYPSKCLDFSRDQCLMACGRLEAFKFNCTNFVFPIAAPATDYCQGAAIRAILLACGMKCNMHEECHSLQYEIKSSAYTEEKLASLSYLSANNMTFLDILPPWAETSVAEDPAMTLTSFTVYISGLLGLWYGVNFVTLKELALSKVTKRVVRAMFSSTLVAITVAHWALEMQNYMMYTTTTLTSYERRDYIFAPKLCFRDLRSGATVESNHSAIELIKFYPDHMLSYMMIVDAKRHQIMYYDHRNISLLNWYSMIDVRGKTTCIDPINITLSSSALDMIYPAYRLFKFFYWRRNQIPLSYRMSSPLSGSGFESKPSYISVGHSRRYYFTVHSQLLPSPYSSMCYNYPNTRESCINRCLRETSYKMNKRLHHLAQICINDSRPMSVNDTEDEYPVNRKCSKICQRPNCRVISYQLEDRREVGYVGMSEDVYLNDLMSSSTFYPVLTLCDHIVILFELAGLWLGFSVVGLAGIDRFYETMKDTRVDIKRIRIQRIPTWAQARSPPGPVAITP
ncbi:hypothetical protein HDE_06986 [Halotydeus destructor]|nr:hypothetical protein HDE_06986 [Halotydeus destructor]